MTVPGYAPQPSRPIGVAILAVLVVLVGAILLLAAIAVFAFSSFIALAGLPTFGLAIGGILGGILLIVALLWIAVGLGLWHLRSWAWWLAVIVMVLSIIGAFASPTTVVIPLILLIYLILVRQHFH